jgi:Uncharacterized protein conserved in bacteria (DUF2066)
MWLRLIVLWALALSFAVPVQAQRYADLFSVEGIEVDVVGPTAEDARIGAFREAAKKGWKRLWDRLVDPSSKGNAPGLTDGSVSGYVTSIDVSKERMSSTRYIATFRIFYDPSAVRRALAGAGAGYGGARNKAMLLLPLLVDGGASSVYEPGNIWGQAWAKFPLLRSKVDYIRADGTLADTALLNPTEVMLRNPERTKAMSLRYRADGIVVARAALSRTYPGGPVTGRFTGYTMTSPGAVTQFTLTAAKDRDLPTLFDEAIRRFDIVFSASDDKVKRQTYGPKPVGVVQAYGGIVGYISTPDAAALNSWLGRLKSTQTVRSVTTESLSIGGSTELRIAVSETRDYLRWALQQRSLFMERDGFIREALPGDPVLERPQTRAEIEAQERARAEAEEAKKQADADAAAAEIPQTKPKSLLPTQP